MPTNVGIFSRTRTVQAHRRNIEEEMVGSSTMLEFSSESSLCSSVVDHEWVGNPKGPPFE